MQKLNISNRANALIFTGLAASITIAGLIIWLIIKAFNQLDSNKIQVIQPIILVLIGILPSIATVLISELIKFKSGIQLKEIEKREDMLSKRETMYKSLLENIEGFIVPEDESKKAIFFREYRIAWLYANDDVLRAINSFLNSVNRSNSVSQERRIESYQNVISSMRNDIITLKPLSGTSLESKDFSNTGSSKRIANN